ncbi:hypothetical protein [Sinomonas sp. G460-2]|uniref:hypothetical protein n=1 Tax=Sinomonas sp. G460-2 TaxID=3393464 RepID=UPI0039EFFB3D
MVGESHPISNQQSSLPQEIHLEQVLDWGTLTHLDELELVSHSGEPVAAGRVDMLAPDGSVLWLIQDNGKGRALFLPEDDVVVFRHTTKPEQANWQRR